jgi:hypothetical protein
MHSPDLGSWVQTQIGAARDHPRQRCVLGVGRQLAQHKCVRVICPAILLSYATAIYLFAVAMKRWLLSFLL